MSHTNTQVQYRLREARRGTTLTTQQAADVIGCSAERISAAENGLVGLSETELAGLADLYRVLPTYFSWTLPGRQAIVSSPAQG